LLLTIKKIPQVFDQHELPSSRQGSQCLTDIDDAMSQRRHVRHLVRSANQRLALIALGLPFTLSEGEKRL
jgi:hypothetical protein